MNARQFKKLNEEVQEELEKERLIEQEKQRRQREFYLSQQGQRGIQLSTKIVHHYDKGGDNIYLNVVINHSQLQTFYPAPPPALPLLIGARPIIAEYNVTKTIPIIPKCSDYYCSVVRFSIPLDSIPLFIMPIIPNQIPTGSPPVTDPNLTPFIIGIRYNAVNYPVNLDYISRANPAIFPPPQQDQVTQVITPYYYVFSYAVLVDMLNAALLQALTASGILAALPAPPTLPLINPNVPFFYLDPVTNLMSLVYPPYFAYLTSPLTDVPTIFVNSLLKAYIDSFDYSFIGFDQPQGRDFQLLLSAPTPNEIYYPANFVLPPNATVAPIQAPIIFYRLMEEYSVLEYWSNLRKLLISTNTIPIAAESIPAANQTSTQVNVSYPILSDFVPNIEQSAGTSRTIAFYLPSAQYRLVDLIGDNSLQKVDLKVFWQDITGNLFPLFISANQQIEIKLGFFKKDLYKKSIEIAG